MAEKVGSRYLSSDTCTLLLGFITLINEFIIVFWVSTLVRDYCCYDSYRLNQWYSVIDWSRQGCREKRRSPINNDPIFIESFCWRAKFNHSIGNAYLNYHDIYYLVFQFTYCIYFFGLLSSNDTGWWISLAQYLPLCVF